MSLRVSECVREREVERADGGGWRSTEMRVNRKDSERDSQTARQRNTRGGTG